MFSEFIIILVFCFMFC